MKPGEKVDKLIKEVQKVCDYGIEGLYEEEIERVSRVMNKSCPFLKINRFGLDLRLTFEQKPYINRFFVLRAKKSNEVLMNIEVNYAIENACHMFEWLNIPSRKWTKFMEEVKKFEDKLDKGDEVKTFLDE